MAGKIKQTSELEFKTKGAQKVQAETEKVGKGHSRNFFRSRMKMLKVSKSFS